MIVLAIDPGATSGWSLYLGDTYVASGAAKSCEVRTSAIDALRALTEREGYASLKAAPVVAAVEMWTVGGRKGRAGKGDRWNPSTMIGMGAARGRWLEQLALAGLPDRRVLSVVPQTWRTILAPFPRTTTEQAKASAVRLAKAIAGRDVGPDEAEGVMIGRWATRAPVALALVAPRKRQRRA